MGEIDVALDHTALPVNVLVRQGVILFAVDRVDHGGVIGESKRFYPGAIAGRMFGDFEGAKLDDIPGLDLVGFGVKR